MRHLRPGSLQQRTFGCNEEPSPAGSATSFTYDFATRRLKWQNNFFRGFLRHYSLPVSGRFIFISRKTTRCASQISKRSRTRSAAMTFDTKTSDSRAAVETVVLRIELQAQQHVAWLHICAKEGKAWEARLQRERDWERRGNVRGRDRDLGGRG